MATPIYTMGSEDENIYESFTFMQEGDKNSFFDTLPNASEYFPKQKLTTE